MNNIEKNSYVRKQILNTLLEQLNNESFESISISRLVNQAGVGRASFYRNYTSKEDVLKQEANRLTEELQMQNKDDDPEDISLKVIHLLDFYKEHSVFYTSLYKAGLTNIILETLLSEAEISPELPNAVAYVKSAFAYLYFGWIIEWIKRGMQESGTELAHMIAESQN